MHVSATEHILPPKQPQCNLPSYHELIICQNRVSVMQCYQKLQACSSHPAYHAKGALWQAVHYKSDPVTSISWKQACGVVSGIANIWEPERRGVWAEWIASVHLGFESFQSYIISFNVEYITKAFLPSFDSESAHLPPTYNRNDGRRRSRQNKNGYCPTR